MKMPYKDPEKQKEYMREYNQNNKEKQKEYYQNNKEKAKEQSKEYYQNNKEKAKEYNTEYRQNNKEEIKEQRKEYYQNNQEKIKEQRKESDKKYRQNNQEKIKEHNKEYRQNNKEEISEKAKEYYQTEEGKRNLQKAHLKRREALHSTITAYTMQEWKEKKNSTEGWCDGYNQETHYVGLEKLTMDHVYPLSIAKEHFEKTGEKIVYTINDIEPICQPCNSSKHNNLETIINE